VLDILTLIFHIFDTQRDVTGKKMYQFIYKHSFAFRHAKFATEVAKRSDANPYRYNWWLHYGARFQDIPKFVAATECACLPQNRACHDGV